MEPSFREALESHYRNWLIKIQHQARDPRGEAWSLYRRNLAGLLPRNRDAAICEIGCGFGHLLHYLQEMGYRNILGIERAEALSRECVQNGLNVIHGDAFEVLESRSELYECVIMYALVEHFCKEDGYRLLRLVCRRLRPGGMVLIVCPNMDNPVTAGRGRYADLTHETGYNGESITHLLAITGFSQMRVREVDHFVTPYPILNALGRVTARLLYTLFKLLFLVHGIRTCSVFSKNMLVTAQKPNAA